MAGSKSLLDLMSPEDRAKAVERGRKRLEKKPNASISPEMYLLAEFGYYMGWEGILAVKRGYIEKVDAKGNTIKEPFTLDEMLVLLEALKKVWYSKLIEHGHTSMIASASKFSKSPGQAFNNGMKPFIDKAEVKES